MKPFLLIFGVFIVCCQSVSGQKVNTDYAQGILKKGKHVGVWKYYEGKELALVINYDSGRVSYSRPDTARQKVWLDSAWQVKRLSRAPLLLGSRTGIVRLLQEQLRYPINEVVNKQTGNVVVSCIIFEDGQLSQPIVELAASPGLGEEVVQVVKKLPMSYVPGIYRGRRVRTKVQFSVKFCIQSSRTSKDATADCPKLNPVVYGGFHQIVVTVQDNGTKPHRKLDIAPN